MLISIPHWIIFNICNYAYFVQSTECDPHSLEFTSMFGPESKFRPTFEQLVRFDGVPLSHCESWSEKALPELRPSLQDVQISLASCRQAHIDLKESHYEFPYVTNSTVDLIQRRRGCSRSENGALSAFETWAVNGADFVTFDPKTLQWKAMSQAAREIASRWNTRTTRNLVFRDFVNIHCPKMIKSLELKYVDQKTDLHISAQVLPNESKFKLRCQVTSTDRSVKLLTLIGEGASYARQVTVDGPLPFGDDYVTLRLTAVIPSSEHQYGCRVQTEKHSFYAFWKPSDQPPTDGERDATSTEFHQNILRLIIGSLALVLAIIVISVVVKILSKCGKENVIATPMVPAHRREEFNRFITGEIPPFIRSFMASYIDPPDRTEQRQNIEEWHNQILNEDVYYDHQRRL